MNNERCAELTKDQKPCGMTSTLVYYEEEDAAYCFAHDPHRKEEFLASASKGGRQARRIKEGVHLLPIDGPVKTAKQAKTVLGWLQWAVLSGEIDKSVCETVTRTITAFQRLLPIAEQEKKLADMDGTIDRLKKLVEKHKTERDNLENELAIVKAQSGIDSPYT